MKNRKKLIFVISAVLILIIAVIIGGISQKKRKQELTLETALFPYIPDGERYENAVSEAWAKIHPDVKLHFRDWDCYNAVPADDLDVFVFDSIYLNEFIDQGYLLPIPEEKIEDREDLVPFVLEGCRREETYYALPEFICSNFLFSRKSDTSLSAAENLSDLYTILGDADSTVQGNGLLIDLSDPVANTTMYLDALTDDTQVYREDQKVPVPLPLSEDALYYISLLWRMDRRNGTTDPGGNDPMLPAQWFAEGKSRAYIGYSESMSAMNEYADQIDLKLFSFSTKKNIPLFFMDAAGINAKISEEEKELAYDLVNILISEEVLLQTILPADETGEPQYLLTAREGVYDTLGAEYPVYLKLKTIINSPDNIVFRLSGEAHGYLEEMKRLLPEAVEEKRKSG